MLLIYQQYVDKGVHFETNAVFYFLVILLLYPLYSKIKFFGVSVEKEIRAVEAINNKGVINESAVKEKSILVGKGFRYRSNVMLVLNNFIEHGKREQYCRVPLSSLRINYNIENFNSNLINKIDNPAENDMNRHTRIQFFIFSDSEKIFPENMAKLFISYFREINNNVIDFAISTDIISINDKKF
jgi:hypothetical protein